MKTHKMNIWHKSAAYSCYLFLGIIFVLLFPMNVKAEPDYGKEIIMVSMGDSFSSGEGIPPFYGPWSIEKKVKDEDWLAHRSKKSWPGQLKLNGLDEEMKNYKVNLKKKSQKGAGKWCFVASSGALTKDIYEEGQNKPYNRKIGNYVYKKDQNPLPKQAEIFDSITKDEVDYITLTLGGNDVGFSDIVKSCAMNVDYSEPNGMPNLLDQAWDKFSEGPDSVKDKLTEIYTKLLEEIGSQGNIIVAGYPQLVAMEGGNTLGLFGFDQIEAAAVNINVSAFNDEIEKIVLDVQKNEHANIYFVSVEDAFIDHGAYEDEPYINQIIIPSTTEDLKDDTSSAFSIHPNEDGAEAYAACVQETIAWIEAGKPAISVSGQVVYKNNQPAGNLSVAIKTEKAGKVVFRGTTNENGEFSGDIKLTNQNLRIVVSNEKKKLIDTPVLRHVEYGNNYLGKIKLDNNEGTPVSESNEQLPIDEEDIYDAALDKGTTAMLQDFVAQSDFMYGKSYKYTLYPFSQYNPEQSEEWEGISPGQSLGYSIEDFDDDGDMELLVITLTDGYHLQFDMYEVIDGEVTLSASKFLDSDDGYPAPQIPNAESYDNKLCGSLSCCVSDDNHRIFLQSTDILWIGGGEEIFVVSVIYKNNTFLDYKVSHLMCNGLMEFERTAANQELSDMGVPSPDIDRIYNEFLPVVECFNGAAHEILHAEQHGIDYEMMDYDYLKVVSQTDFFTNDNMALEDVSTDDSAQSSEAANYLELYAELLEELRATAITPSRLVFQLIYLDDDEIPELVVTEGSSVESQVWLYSFKDGKVIQIFCNGGDWGNHGSLYYIERESIVLNAFTTVASGNYAFYRIEDGQATFIKEFSKKPSTNESEYSFYVGGNPVSEEDYEKQYDECGGNRLIAAGYYYGTVVSPESIQLLLENDPISYQGEGGPF